MEGCFSLSGNIRFEGLRQHISEVFWNNKIEKNHILIVSGAQQGIDIISKSIINVNDNVLIENLHIVEHFQFLNGEEQTYMKFLWKRME